MAHKYLQKRKVFQVGSAPSYSVLQVSFILECGGGKVWKSSAAKLGPPLKGVQENIRGNGTEAAVMVSKLM